MFKSVLFFLLISCFSLAAENGRIFFNRMDKTMKNSVWCCNSDGSNPEKLTKSTENEYCPCVSPDDDILYYAADISREVAVFSRFFTSETAVRISPFFDEIYDMAVSPDGKKILFSAFSKKLSDHDYDIYMMNGDGSSLEAIITDHGPDTFPRMTPDGKNVIFQSSRGNGYQIFSYSTLTKKTTCLTTISGAIAFSPCVTPDGKNIVFVLFDKAAKSGLFLMDLFGKNQKQVYVYPVGELCPAVSPDGKKVVLSLMLGSSRNQLYTVNLDGTDSRRITNEDGFCIFPFWSSR